jgi:hypothetical protein
MEEAVIRFIFEEKAKLRTKERESAKHEAVEVTWYAEHGPLFCNVSSCLSFFLSSDNYDTNITH